MEKSCFKIRIPSAFASLAVVVSLFTTSSCEKEIEFRGEETAPRLVLYSLSEPGQRLMADVSSSVFFLKQNYDNKLFTSSLDTLKGGLKVYVNGSATPYVMRYTPMEDDYFSYFRQARTLHYEADYITISASWRSSPDSRQRKGRQPFPCQEASALSRQGGMYQRRT